MAERRPINLDDIHTIGDLERAAKGHFFDADTMLFFDSKVYDGFKRTTDGLVFITSERDKASGTPRYYTLRILEADGYVRSLSDFGEYLRLDRAQKALAALDGRWA